MAARSRVGWMSGLYLLQVREAGSTIATSSAPGFPLHRPEVGCLSKGDSLPPQIYIYIYICMVFLLVSLYNMAVFQLGLPPKTNIYIYIICIGLPLGFPIKTQPSRGSTQSDKPICASFALTARLTGEVRSARSCAVSPQSLDPNTSLEV